MKKISTTKLSDNLEISSKELYKQLLEQKLITKIDDKWSLTKKGEKYGGEIISSKKYGEYIVWPTTFDPFVLKTDKKEEFINITSVGKKFNLSSQRMNLILAEIGWIEKALKGWNITSLGKKVGGVQHEHKSGATYVLWPKEILNNKSLSQSILEEENISEEENKTTHIEDSELSDFRTKFPANIRTKDGHQVRSRAEAIIDNALYDYGLAHAYERKLPIQEDVYSDFYIPSKNGGKAVYIEFWGLENDPKYSHRKEIKKNIYAKYELNLIELNDKHIECLDDYLPRMLLKFGIRVE